MKLSSFVSDWQPAPRPSPSGRALFAIGDVHGHARHLKLLQDRIARRIREAYRPEDVTLVWLGDYIDRGPHPLASLDLVAAGLGIPGIRQIRLRGNHDQFLIDALDEGGATCKTLQLWFANGGLRTLNEFLPDQNWRKPEELTAALRAALGADRIAFLKSLRLIYQEDGYVFAHAGIDPAAELDSQVAEKLIWIREPFLSGEGWHHDVVVVHGHTPGEPVCLPHRIGVDSGVFYTGRLTAAEIHGDTLRFHAVYENEPALVQ